MSDVPGTYPFDPTGRRESNRIVKEKQVLTPPGWKDFHFIIPKVAPFFRDTMKIFNRSTGQELEEGVDWIATHRFMDASRATARPIYGSITFYDNTLSGVVELSYNTLGGEWAIDTNKIAEILINNQVNPRITTWSEIVDVPRQFPVIDHEWHLDDMVGMSEVEQSIRDLANTVEKKNETKNQIMGHVYDRENPHEVTKDQVGLDRVENYPPATEEQAVQGQNNASYMTPRKTRFAIDSRLANLYYTKEEVDQMYNDLLSLIEDISGEDNAYSIHLSANNPHGVTKDQVGLGDVENAEFVRIADASGEITDMMATLTSGQAI